MEEPQITNKSKRVIEKEEYAYLFNLKTVAEKYFIETGKSFFKLDPVSQKRYMEGR